jgi:uncharacterized protein YbjT (DUF2867 family)
MVATNGRTVTVFGGTGFLGRRIVRHLRYREFSVRIASRHPDRGHRLFGPDDPQLQSVEANVHDERSVADAVAGAWGVVNAVSLYLERGQETFHSVHVEAAQRVAAQARNGPVSIGSFTFQESAPTPPHDHGTSESVAKANWRSGPPSAMHFSSARR